MAGEPADILDVAIVGGGISGLYSGWRLLTGRTRDGSPLPKKVAVFELSGRTGGRLLTWHPCPDKAPGLNAELGGMRFFRQQELVWGLITNYFVKKGKLQAPIKFFVADPNRNNLWYLRESVLKTADLTNPRRLPYRLDASGRYADPSSILNGVIARLLWENREEVVKRLAGRTAPTNWEDWDAIKPFLLYHGRKVWDTGFWNLLWDQLSPETYSYVTDAFGYYSLTNNWNAAEAMQALFSDFTQNPDYHTLHEGYEYLPQLVREEFEHAGGTVLLNTPVAALDRADSGLYRLTLGAQGQERTVLARHVILAMPRRSLELLQQTQFWRLDLELSDTGPGPRSLREYIASVIPYPAFKLFLVYDTPWWRSAPLSIAAGRTVCDLPIRQTYYFPPVPGGFPPDRPPLDGPGLVMASYDDLNAVPFWQTLEPTRKQKQESDAIMEELVARTPVQGNSRLRAYAQETRHALIQDRGFYFAPPEMVRYAQEQLALVHYNQPLPNPVTIPGHPEWFLAAYKDWSIDPFGGGWNFWAPSVDVKDVMQRMRRPIKDANVYIVGEAYSGAQAWVEGALTTAEKVLRDAFHLDRADWQPCHYYMGY